MPPPGFSPSPAVGGAWRKKKNFMDEDNIDFTTDGFWDGLWDQSYDDNAGVSLANAQATSPLTTSNGSSTVSPNWLGFLQSAIGAAGTAYGATVTADKNLQQVQATNAASTNTARLLIYLGIGAAVILGAVLLLRRK